MNMQDIRAKYPQYDDLSDIQLLKGIHKKSYSDMPFGEFMGKVNGVKQKLEPNPRTGAQELAHQTGLTIRHGLQGLADAADVFAEPIRYGLQSMGVETGNSLSKMVEDMPGLPKPENNLEKAVGVGARSLASLSPFVKAGQAGGVLSNLAAKPGEQAAATVAGGMSYEGARQQGADTGGQLVASFAGGVSPAVITSGLKNTFGSLSKDLEAKLTTKVRDAIENGFLDEEGFKRLLDYYKTGATPTRAMISQDPVEMTQQRNLAAIGAQSSNPNLQKLSQIENENARKLLDQLDKLTGGQQLDLYRAGEVVSDKVQQRSNIYKAVQNNLYKQASEKAGRTIELDRTQFIDKADQYMRKDNVQGFLPETVRKRLNEIAYGEINAKGETFRVPFTVDDIDSLETVLSREINKAQRAGDGNAVQALQAVKKALIETPVEGELGQEALKAYRHARNFSRRMYQWQESVPAIKAIIEGVEPDNFMKTYILGGTDKASVGNVGKLMAQLKGDKQATGIIRGQVAAWLRDKAQPNDTLDKINPSRLNEALKAIGDRKLAILFSPKDVSMLKAISRVARYEANVPAGEKSNKSFTATTAGGMFFNWLAKVGESLPVPLSRELLTTPIRNVQNTLGGKGAFNPQIARSSKSADHLMMPLAIGGGSLTTQGQ